MIHERIAAGGMATVHLGRLNGPAGFGRTVAIKRLHDGYARDPDFVAMLLDEARLTATIHHTNVVPTVDIVAEDDELLVVMEYVEGESLGSLAKAAAARGERVPPSYAASILAQALHGLHAAHEAKDRNGEPLGIVHRDVSPQNILVGVDGIARVLDFGIAKAASRSTATEDGQVKGKTAYMAPEQLALGAVDRRTDVFSAAVVLWEVLAGKRLFYAESPAATRRRVLEESIPSPREHVPDLAPQLEAVVMRGLDRDPTRRYESAAQMAIALEVAVPLPRPVEIGTWVRELAAKTLEERAEIVREVERASSPPIPVSTPRGSALAGAIALAERRRMAGDAPTDVGGKRVGSDEHAVDTLVMTPRSGSSTPRSARPEVTELASIASTRVQPARAKTRRKGDVFPIAFAAFGALMLLSALVVALVFVRRPPPIATPEAVPAAPPPAALTTVQVQPAPPPPGLPPPPPSTATPAPHPHRPTPGKKKPTAPSTPSAPAAIDCERDPWIVDSHGLKRIRPECR